MQSSIEQPLTDEEFEQEVQKAIDGLPEEFLSRMADVSVVINEGNPNRNLMGVFDRYGGLKRIVLFRDTIERVGRDEQGVRDQIRLTTLHEIGHYFGMNERQLREIGYG